jgi:hypothetical protein
MGYVSSDAGRKLPGPGLSGMVFTGSFCLDK